MVVCEKNLKALKEMGVKVPSYDRAALKPSVAHIGLGHFHRSHFLTYMDELLDKGAYDGGVFEIDVIPAKEEFIASLRSQDYLYSVLSMAPDGGEELRINGPVVGYANESEDPSKVLSVLSSPDISLITLTITEKGYRYLDDEGTLDWNDPLVIHDLTSSDPPVTAVGCLSKALRKRYDSSSLVTVMSCDNVPENGVMLRRCVLQFCQKKYPEIVEWVSSSIAFPCTMVDRITPGTGDEDIKRLHDRYGIEDRCPVHCEAFRQWVIEDNFCTNVPDFASAGALVVKDVKPYELMKIRLLNGSHSALSYPAYMMGIRAVHEAAADPLIRAFIRDRYMEEITLTLSPVPGMNLDAYKDELIARFSNPHIADTILRLASDGSKKIANAILRPLEEGLRKGLPVDALILALAMWEFYFICRGDHGEPMPIDDPKKDELLSVCEDPAEFLRIAGLSEDMLSHPVLTEGMKARLNELGEKGVRTVLSEYLSCRG